MLKDEVKKIIDNLPDNASLEDIQYTLYVQMKIKEGLDDLDKGNIISHDEVEKRLEKWLKQ
ncbi:hypothetical protein TEPIDINF_001593 [Tepidibacillus infernus]|uniref:Threonyl-tRNA synthetase n=1 Tax=Tepidibacillus decaturensis TaxID=1413211 RepID=A0A135L5J6_9BACI|nr:MULTISPECIES: hypothetical protein [Tepidibacillus]KXG44113.1 hypothetical protein U473_08940 [Tepidibacillus decaturensis]GBF12247.1 hypothetical protein HK1_02308 [Tepidibacillus sp. HK-1]